jgi:hypothetical protein
MPKGQRKTEELAARVLREHGRALGLRSRPYLHEWLLEQAEMPSGVFLLDCVTATLLLPAAHTKWACGMLEGEEPTAFEIGRALRTIGCTPYKAGSTKLWILPGRKVDAVMAKGGKYWERRVQRALNGGDPEWVPDPIEPPNVVQRKRMAAAGPAIPGPQDTGEPADEWDWV